MLPLSFLTYLCCNDDRSADFILDFGFTKDLHDDQFGAASHFSRSRCEAGAYDAGVFRSPESNLHTAIGTTPYCGPEMGAVVSGAKKIEGLDPFKQDMFACGVCLYAMITGSFPFGMNQVDRANFQKLLDGGDEAPPAQLHSKFWSHRQRVKTDQLLGGLDSGAQIKALLNQLFSAKSECRPSAAEVLQSPWLADYEPEDQSLDVLDWIDGNISEPTPGSILECLANRRQPGVLQEILASARR